MSENPYQSPSIQPVQTIGAHGGATTFYRSAHTMVFWLTALFIVNMVFSGLLGAMSVLHATIFADALMAEFELEDPAAMGFIVGFACLALIYLGMYFATAVLFCLWIYRANKNARALGARGMTFTPGWSVGWFFVPIAHLFKPYQATCEVYRASRPTPDGLGWRSAEVPAVIGSWWALWIITNILGHVEMRLDFQDDPNLLLASAWVGVVNGVLGIPAAFLALQVVRLVHKRQEESAEAALHPQHSTPIDDVGL